MNTNYVSHQGRQNGTGIESRELILSGSFDIHVGNHGSVHADGFVNPRIGARPTWTTDQHGAAIGVQLLAPLAKAVYAIVLRSAHALDKPVTRDESSSDLVRLHLGYGSLRKDASAMKHAVAVDHCQEVRIIVQAAARATAEHGTMSAVLFDGYEMRAGHP